MFCRGDSMNRACRYSKELLAQGRLSPCLDLSTTLAESGGGGHLQAGFVDCAVRSLHKYLPGAE